MNVFLSVIFDHSSFFLVAAVIIFIVNMDNKGKVARGLLDLLALKKRRKESSLYGEKKRMIVRMFFLSLWFSLGRTASICIIVFIAMIAVAEAMSKMH